MSQQGADVMEKAMVGLWTQNIKTQDIKQKRLGWRVVGAKIASIRKVGDMRKRRPPKHTVSNYAIMLSDILFADL